MAETVLVEAKNVATDRLVDLLCPHIYNGLLNMYKQASQMNKNESIKMFQMSLMRISTLPENILKSDYTFLIKEGKCNEKELTMLIESLFVCVGKLSLLARGVKLKEEINLKDLEIPTNINFVHQCYINAAREIFPGAQLFSHKYTFEQQAQNREFINQKIIKGIQQTIRELTQLNTLYEKYIRQGIGGGGSTKHKVGNRGLNNLESLMNVKIDTSFVDDLEEKAKIGAQKLSEVNLTKLKHPSLQIDRYSKVTVAEKVQNQPEFEKKKPILRLKPTHQSAETPEINPSDPTKQSSQTIQKMTSCDPLPLVDDVIKKEENEKFNIHLVGETPLVIPEATPLIVSDNPPERVSVGEFIDDQIEPSIQSIHDTINVGEGGETNPKIGNTTQSEMSHIDNLSDVNTESGGGRKEIKTMKNGEGNGEGENEEGENEEGEGDGYGEEGDGDGEEGDGDGEEGDGYGEEGDGYGEEGDGDEKENDGDGEEGDGDEKEDDGDGEFDEEKDEEMKNPTDIRGSIKQNQVDLISQLDRVSLQSNKKSEITHNQNSVIKPHSIPQHIDPSPTLSQYTSLKANKVGLSKNYLSEDQESVETAIPLVSEIISRSHTVKPNPSTSKKSHPMNSEEEHAYHQFHQYIASRQKK